MKKSIFCASVLVALTLTGCASAAKRLDIAETHPANARAAQGRLAPLEPFLMADTNLVVMTTKTIDAPEEHQHDAKPEAKTPHKHE